jgi:hypothetical protein
MKRAWKLFAQRSMFRPHYLQFNRKMPIHSILPGNYAELCSEILYQNLGIVCNEYYKN